MVFVVRKMLEGTIRQVLDSHLYDSRNSCINLSVLADGANSQIALASKYGGNPWLLNEMEWPRDRKGMAMEFVGQINFAHMPAAIHSVIERGLMLVFRCIDHYPAKDKAGFRVVWIDCPEEKSGSYRTAPVPTLINKEKLLSGNVVPVYKKQLLIKELSDLNLSASDILNIEDYILQFNDSRRYAHQLLGPEDMRSAEAKLVCAFAANGITFDQQRKVDPMFEHLVKAADQWQLLWRIGEDWSNYRSRAGELLVMIHSEDLKSGNLGKSWLLTKG